MKIPIIVRIKSFSDEFRNACEFLGINPEEYLSKLTSIFLILFLIVGISSLFFGLKVLYFSIILVIFYLFLQEYPKILYKRKLTSHYDEIPYILSLFSSSYSITGNFENAFYEVENLFRDNVIIQEVKEDLQKRFIEGREYVKIKDPSIRDFFEYIFMSFSTKNKEKIIKKGFSSFMNNYRRKKIEEVNKLHLKILFLFIFGTAIPLILLTALPVMSFFVKGFLKYLTIMAIFTSSLILNVILIYDMKGKLTFLFERIKKKSKKPKWIYFVPFLISFPSIIYLFRFFEIYTEISIVNVVKFNLIPFSFVVLYFLYIYYDTKDAIKIEREIRKELSKITQFSDAMIEYLDMKLSFENSLKKSLERIGMENKISLGIEIRENFTSKTFKWLIRKIIGFREKSYKTLQSLIETFKEMISILNDYMDELKRRTQNLSNVMKYTALFILPIISAVTIKAAAMIFASYEESLKLAENQELFVPIISLKVSELDFAIINLLLFSYSIIISYLLLDFSLYLEYGESPSKKRLTALYLLISASIFLGSSIFMSYL